MDITFKIQKVPVCTPGESQGQNDTQQFFVDIVPSVGEAYHAGPMEEWVADRLILRLRDQEVFEEMTLNFKKMLKIEIYNRVQAEIELAMKEGRKPSPSISQQM